MQAGLASKKMTFRMVFMAAGGFSASIVLVVGFVVRAGRLGLLRSLQFFSRLESSGDFVVVTVDFEVEAGRESGLGLAA